MNITLPFLPPGWTQGIDTGMVLAVLIALEFVGLRRRGLLPGKLGNARSAHIDHLGHLSGFATGIAAALIIRSTVSIPGHLLTVFSQNSNIRLLYRMSLGMHC